ncbi:MAG: hypothetical protein PWQ16_743 [bacterium]|nr:MAG: hypothetical protein XD52_0672 [bacterium 42_11]MDK2871391.1 hypothetical protein [bacterium]
MVVPIAIKLIPDAILISFEYEDNLLKKLKALWRTRPVIRKGMQKPKAYAKSKIAPDMGFSVEAA